MPEEPKPIAAPRCLGCGAWHPFISPCPYVKRQVVRIEPTRRGGRDGHLIEIVETEYFDERMALAKHSVQSEEELRQLLKEPDPA